MKNNLKIFENKEFGKVRIKLVENEPYFCLKDLCNSLELSNHKEVKSRLDKGVITTYPLETTGGRQNLTFINEDGLYDVILDSRKPEAKKFRKWVTSEVLQKITGKGQVYFVNKFLRKENFYN